jgi:hypothetical protein
MAKKPVPAGLTFDSPARYQIRAQGQINERWSDRLEGMVIRLDTSTNGPSISTLEGELLDQAALVGVFNTLYELHLPVLSVQCLTSLETTARERQRS